MAKRSSDGGGERVRRSAAQGRALVESWRRSGASVSEFCRRQGVKEHVLRYWVSREPTRSSQPAARARSEFFVVSAPEVASGAPSSMATGAGGAFIVVLPEATAGLLVQTLRGLLREGLA